MITRRCLRDESLYPTRRLEEEFAGHQELKFYDEAGHEYTLQAGSEGCLRGAGQLYRDHNLGVNDLLLLTPLLPGAFRVESVVKPYERPKASWEETAESGADGQSGQRSSDAVSASAMPSSPPQATRITPHVREVRPGSEPSAFTKPAPEKSADSRAAPAAPGGVQSVGGTGVRIQEVRRSAALPALAPVPEQARAQAQQDGEKRRSENATTVQVRAIRTSEQSGHEPAAQQSFPDYASHRGRRGSGQARHREPQQVPRIRVIRGVRQAKDPQTELASMEPRESQRGADSNPAAAASARLQRDLRQRESRGQEAGRQGGAEVEGGRSHAQQPETGPAFAPQATPTDRALQELGRLTGYRVDYLGGGLTRLRADLGRHSHHVLIADSASAASSHEWRSRSETVPTYKLWLVDEGQAVADAPIVTRDAVQMLLKQARLAPLSALDLRPYWHARRMDARSAENLAGLAKQYLAQRGAFAGVLAALAQQPANSLVSRARLAELPLGLSPTDLDRALHTLAQPPLQLLSPIDKEEFLLRQSIPAFLAGFGEYVRGVSRRLVTAEQLGLEAALDDPKELRAATCPAPTRQEEKWESLLKGE